MAETDVTGSLRGTVWSVAEEAMEKSIYGRIETELQMPDKEKAEHGQGGRLLDGWKAEVGVKGETFYRFLANPETTRTEKPTVLGHVGAELASKERGTGSFKAINALLELTKDTYAPHRALAVTGIQTVMEGVQPLDANSEVVGTILYRLKFERRAKVREAILQIIPHIVKFGDGTAVRALLNTLDDPDRHNRELVIEALFLLLVDGPTKVGDDEENSEHANTEGALESLEDAVALRDWVLEKLVGETLDAANTWFIREAATRAIARLGYKGMDGVSTTAQTQNITQEQGGGSSEEEEQGGREWVRDVRHVLQRLESLRRERSPYLRASYLRVLGALGPSNDTPLLLQACRMLRDQDEVVRDAALAAMSELGGGEGDVSVAEALLALIAPPPPPPPAPETEDKPDAATAEETTQDVSCPRQTDDTGRDDGQTREESGSALSVSEGAAEMREEGDGGGKLGESEGARQEGEGGVGEHTTADGAEREDEKDEEEKENAEDEQDDQRDGGGGGDSRLASAKEKVTAGSGELGQPELAAEDVCLSALRALQAVCPRRPVMRNPHYTISRTSSSPERHSQVSREFLERLVSVMEQVARDSRSAVRLCGIETAAAILAPGHGPVVKEVLRRLETVDVSEVGGLSGNKMQGMRVGDGSKLSHAMAENLDNYRTLAWRECATMPFGQVEPQRIRLAALDALPSLARRGEPAALHAVFAQLLDTSAHVRLTAVTTLGKVADKGVRACMMAAVGLLQDREGLVRQAAGVALMACTDDNDEATIRQLAPLLDVTGSNKRSTMIRNQAAMVLNLLSDHTNQNTKAVLHQRLHSHDPEVRETAANTLVELVLGNVREGQNVVSQLLPLLDDDHWFVVCAALSGISRIEANRQEASSKGRPKRLKQSLQKATQTGWDSPVTQKVVDTLRWTHDDRAATVRETALETLKVVALKGDLETMRAVLEGLMCEDAPVRKTAITAVRILGDGEGDLGQGDYYEKVIEVTMGMLFDLSQDSREVAELELERDQLQWRMRKTGVDRTALKKQLTKVEAAVAKRGLTREQKLLVAGRMAAVMDCLCSVVPRGHESSIRAVVSCFQDAAFDVRECALKNLCRLADRGNGVALEELVKLLASPATHCRWAAAEALLLVATKGDRKLLANMLLVMDNPDRFLRHDLVGAVCGVLLPNDFAAIVTAIADSRATEQLKVLLAEGEKLEHTLREQREEERAGMEAVEREMALLEGALLAAERDLKDAEWVEQAEFWEVEARKRWVQAKGKQLDQLWHKAQGHGPAYHAIMQHQSKVRGLAVQALTAKVADDKQRRAVGPTLCNKIEGMEEYVKDLQLGVGQSWLSGTGLSRAKQVFNVTKHKFNQQARSKWTH